jgi:hypothetical protein
MTDIDAVAASLRGRRLTDILVTGYIDGPESKRRFHPMFDDVYFDFDGLLLRASATDQFWYVELDLVDRVECRFQIEEDDEFGVCPLDFVLRHPGGPYHLRQIITFTAHGMEASSRKAVCAALVLEFEGTEVAIDTLFMDPRNEFGIQLGTEAALAEWRRANAGAESPAVERAHPAIPQ